jgi:3',5'-cyclic AMP phosphodiesterase CpdA
MRIAVTSDLHLFPRWLNKIQQLAAQLEALEPDVLILAGDTGEPIEFFMQGLAIFRHVCNRRAVIAGNHDVWHRVGDHSSELLWDALLAEAAAVYDYTWLEQETLVIDGLGIGGSLAWYDYGGRHPALEFDEAFYEFIKHQVSNDANYVDWPWSDREFAQMVSDAFLHRLDALQAAPDIENILVATHVPLFKECVRPVQNLMQGISNAYYANVSLGKEVIKRSKVRAIISGHVHQDTRLQIPTSNGHRRQIWAYTNPSDYGAPAALLLDTDTWQVEVIKTQIPTLQAATA